MGTGYSYVLGVNYIPTVTVVCSGCVLCVVMCYSSIMNSLPLLMLLTDLLACILHQVPNCATNLLAYRWYL